MLKREVDYSRKFEEILKNSRNGGIVIYSRRKLQITRFDY